METTIEVRFEKCPSGFSLVEKIVGDQVGTAWYFDEFIPFSLFQNLFVVLSHVLTEVFSLNLTG